MENDSGGAEGDFDVLLGGLGPVQDLLNVIFLDGKVIAVTDSGLEQDTDGVGELLDTGVTKGGQLVKVVLLASMFDGALDRLVKGVWLRGGGEGSGRDGRLLSVIDKFLHIRLNS